MPWLRFNDDFDFRAKKSPAVTIAYKKGSTYLVSQRCAAEAVAKGKAEPVKRQKNARL